MCVQVFSVIGHFDNFPEADDSGEVPVPDYGKLYRFIAACMDETLGMPELTPLG